MEPRTSRKIVSKGRYAATLGAKASLLLIAVGLAILGGIFLYVTYGIISLLPQINVSACIGILIILAVGGGAAWLLFWSARQVIVDAKRMDTGVPLTLANTADLPATETLVRASSEPLQAQEAVLLRAVAETGQERYEEELVRASMG